MNGVAATIRKGAVHAQPMRLHLRNEFATVAISLDNSGNGTRLCIRDLRYGKQVLLDLLEVECLTRIGPDVFLEHVMPA